MKKKKNRRKERFRIIKTERKGIIYDGREYVNRTQHSFVCFQVFSSLKVMGSWRGANFARFYC